MLSRVIQESAWGFSRASEFVRRSCANKQNA
jgi:hypothetical protein